MGEVFIPSLTLPEDVLLPHLNWRKLIQFRHRYVLEVAAAWAMMRPFTPETAATCVHSRVPRSTFGISKHERRLPLLFQLLGILRRAREDGNIVNLCNSIAPTIRDFRGLVREESRSPKWDDIDGGRRYPLRSFLLCAVI
jgi:hypothetical protein